MALFYSASRHGFFDDAIHRDLPPDAVKISAARHRALLNAQGDGAAIEAGDDGRPRIRRPATSRAERRAAMIRQTRREAARRIEAIAPPWRQLNDLRAPSDAGAARFAAIDAVRTASDAIEAEIAAAPTMAALDALGPLSLHPLWRAE